jgi:hypothetical protein
VCLLLLYELTYLLHIHLLQFFQLPPLLFLLHHQVLRLSFDALQFVHLPPQFSLPPVGDGFGNNTRLDDEDGALLGIGIAGAGCKTRVA